MRARRGRHAVAHLLAAGAVLVGMLGVGVSGCSGAAGAAGTGGAPGGAAPASNGASFRLGDPLDKVIAPFEVVGQGGEPYEFPFLGGFDVPRPQLVDIDGDGDYDLFVQKYRGELMFFENVGTPTEPRFEWRTSNYQGLDVGEWARFYDLDGDGTLDMLMEMPSSYIRFARNVGTPAEPRFEIMPDSVRNTAGRPIFADAQNIPHLVDLTCSGTPDLFLGRIDGTVARYRLAEFQNGHPTFELVTERFENIEIIGVFGVPGGPLPGPGDLGGAGLASLAGLDGLRDRGGAERPSLHGANSMAFGDWNGDGALDLFWGDFFEPGLLLIENIGTCERPNLEFEPRPVPADPPILTSGYNAPVLADLNGNGHLDLLIGVLGGAYNPNQTSTDNLLLYAGRPDNTFELQTRRFLNGLDIGSESVPTFGDLTGNGLPDLLIGSKLDPETSLAPPLHWYENTGTAAEPRFVFRTTIPEVAELNGAPVLADMNGNGRLDLVIGSFNRNIRYYRNEGSAEAPRFVSASDEPLARLPRGSYSAPTVGDLTGNGLLDLVVGEASGDLNYFRNVGTPSEPSYELVTEELGGINVGSRSSPLLVDLDGDGLLDLLVGNETGNMFVFINMGTPTEPVFEGPGQRLDRRFPRLAAPRLVDLNGDGALDMVLGDQGGGLVFLRNGRVSGATGNH